MLACSNLVYSPFMGVARTPFLGHLPLVATLLRILLLLFLVLVFWKERIHSKDSLSKGLFSKAKQTQHSKERQEWSDSR